MRISALFLALGLIATGCQQPGGFTTDTVAETDAVERLRTRILPADTRYVPEPATTWQWQLNGTINTNYAVGMYDIDLFDATAPMIARLQAEGKRVICYFSAGSQESWRPDATDFLTADLGNSRVGWPGERWLDVRSTEVRTIMARRLDVAARKGCDGVEPDNVDGYASATGFPLNAQDQLDFNRFLANEAHKRWLSIGLKNDLDQVAQLVADFDFSVNEQCHEYNECEMLRPFTDAGKAVFNVEYASIYITDPTQLCVSAIGANMRTLVLPPTLDDSFRISCD